MENMFYRLKYSRRRGLHNYNRDQVRPPRTPEITSQKPTMFDDENEEDWEKEEEVFAEEEDEDNSDDEVEEEHDGDAKCVCKKQSRSEKKSRKAMLKLGLEPVSGVHRVTVKRNENSFFVVSNPDVYKSPSSESYVIFGKTKVEEITTKAETEEEEFKAADVGHLVSEAGSSGVVKEEDEGIDESGMDPRDIELVMTQTGLSRASAAQALKAADNDIVTAIMEHIN